MEADTYTARVARGAALLDATRPGWIDAIDLDTLDLHNAEFCILGQVYSDHGRMYAYGYYAGRAALWPDDANMRERHSHQHGFTIATGSIGFGFAMLDDAWRKLIATRRGTADEG